MYKVTLYERTEYPNNGQVLLDTSSGNNPGVNEVKYEGKLNEAGSFTFSVIPSHPLYDTIEPLCTFVSVEEDGTEIFYGRVLMEKTNRITGIKQVTCEGALAFLLDVEMGEDSEETTSTPGGYFGDCVFAFRDKLRDDLSTIDYARRISPGYVNVPGTSASAKFKNGSRTQIQSVMKSKLLNVYDGFFRIRRSGTNHYLDWVSQVGATNPQPIRIKQNVVSHTTTKSGEDVFTMLWPKGNSKEGGGNVEISPIALSTAMVQKYGVIIRTVNFDADDEETLRTKAMAHIAKIQDRLSLNGEINFVDMSYLDGTHPKVHLGDVFTNIDGFEGTKLTAATVSKDLLDPKNDKLSLKTDKDLMSSSGVNGTNSSSSNSGSGSGGGRSLSGAGSKWYKFIHETEEDLSLAARNIEITAEEKIKLVSQRVETQAAEIQTLSTDMGEVKGKWTTFEGTGLYQNRESITTIAGKFRTDSYGRLMLEEGAQFVVSGDGTSTNVGRLLVLDDNTVRDVGQLVAHYQGSYSYQHDDEIAGIVGRYEVETYVDPQNPWKEITPASDANPKALGYYEENANHQFVKTNDETVVEGKKYYIPNDIKKVTFDSGGGYKIKENGVEYGVYTKVGDSAELTGGIIVDKLNDGTTTTKIKGTRVVLGEDLTGDDLSDWAADADNGTGVFAKYLTVKQLTAQEINTMLANIGDADISELTIENDIHVGNEVDATRVSADDVHVSDGGSLSIGEAFLNIVDISFPATNTLRVHYVDGTTQDFSKATTLDTVVSSGTITVNAKQRNSGVDTTVASLPVVISSVLAYDTVTYSNGLLNVPVKVMASINSGNAVDTGYTQDFKVTAAQAMSAVNVTGSWSNGTFTAVSSANSAKKATTAISSVLAYDTVTYTDGLINVPVRVMASVNSGSAAETGYTQNFKVAPGGLLEAKTITANGTYTPSSGKMGFSSIVVNVAGGSGITGLEVDTTNHQIKTSTSETAQSVTISVEKASMVYNASTHKYAYVFSAYAGSSVIASTSDTTGTEAYYAGFDDVYAPSFSSWRSSSSSEPSSDIISNTVTFEVDDTTGGTARTGTRQVNLTESGTWSAGSTQVFLRDNVANGNYIGRITVSMPSSASWSSSIDSTTSGKEYKQYKVYCTVGGKQYGAYTLGTGTSWDHGGQTAHMTYSDQDSRDGTYITINPIGRSKNYIRILAGYVNASGSRAGQTNSVTVSGTTYYGRIYIQVPKLQSKTITSNGTVYPDAGYAGLSSVTVDVPTGHTTAVGMSVSTRSTTSSGKYMYKLTYGPTSTFKNEGDTWRFYL